MNILFLGGPISGTAMGVISQFYDFRKVIQFASIWVIAAIGVLMAMKPENVE